MARSPEQRIRDLVMAAVELNFTIIVGAPVVEPHEILRIRPPIKPDEPLPSLQFYIGKQAWKDYLFLAERYPDQIAAIEAADIQYYKHPKEEKPSAEQSGG